MKIRHGFVSNSSSASFICRNCSEEYDVECRGGTPDDWVSPQAGLCEECGTKKFICKCSKVLPNSKGVPICSEDNRFSDGYEMMDYLICPECLVKEKEHKYTKIVHEWATKVADPGYKLTALDKTIAEAMKNKGSECVHTHYEEQRK
jgi:hypothetical protein